MDIQQIDTLIKGRRYEEALNGCEQVLRNLPKLRFEVLRRKSQIFSARAEYDAAVDELCEIIDAGQATISDHFLAGFWGLYSGKLQLAKECFLTVKEIGEKEGETWFRSAVAFYLAHICLENGQFEEAERFARDIDDEGAQLVPHVGWCTKSQLLDEIHLRAEEECYKPLRASSRDEA